MTANTHNLLEQAYEIANEKQLEALDNMDKFYGGAGLYTKQILMIMDALPEDTPRITLEQAKSICAAVDTTEYLSRDKFEVDMMKKFNEITGAPDFEGGSGNRFVTCFLDEERSQRIMVGLGYVWYIDQNGTREYLLEY